MLAVTGKALKVNDKNMAALAMRGDAYYSMDEFELVGLFCLYSRSLLPL